MQREFLKFYASLTFKEECLKFYTSLASKEYFHSLICEKNCRYLTLILKDLKTNLKV